MKTNKLYTTILLFSVCIVFAGCKKFLDEKSDARLVVPQTLADIQGLLDDGTTMNLAVTPSYGETCADDYFVLPATLERLGTLSKATYSWIPRTVNYANDWSKGYLAIYNSNLSLEILAKIPRNSANAAEWDNVKGSALFFRSYFYLMLTAQYGLAYDEQSSISDLGTVIRESSDFNEVSVRSTVKTCYDRVIKDLEESINYLPDFPRHTLRPSKAAAYALLARTGLYKRDYAMGQKYSELALKLKSDLMNFNGDADLNSLSAAIPVKRFNKETIFYSEMYSGFSLHSPVYAIVDTSLYASYNVNDLRRTAFFRFVSGYPVFKGSYSANANILFSGLTTGEMYLTRAECKAFLGDLSGAMDDLNALLRKRWKTGTAFVPYAAADKATALITIRSERRKEMLMRGTRWADIKRQNKEGANIIPIRVVDGKLIRLEPDSRFYALPLPTDIINLTGMPQNN